MARDEASGWLRTLIGIGLAASFAVGHAAAAAAALDADTALEASKAAIGRPVSDYAFVNPLNRTVHLSDFRGRPLVVNMVYTACSDICPTVSQSLADAVAIARDALGRDSFAVITVGFDDRRDTPERMRSYARSHGLSVEGWEFLSGPADSVDGLANAIGFQYIPGPQGFDHVAQTTVIDAGGRVYRQIYGAAFEPPVLVEPLKELLWGTPTSTNAASTLFDRIRLICTVYDPASGRYRFSYAIFISIGLSGLTLIVVGWIIVRAWWRARRNGTAWTKLKKTDTADPFAFLKRPLRAAYMRCDRFLDYTFGSRDNPFYSLGGLGFFLYWIIAVSGIYVFAFFDTGLTEAYESVEAMTHIQWWLGGVMRSLHRYASDGLILVIGLHIIREFAFDRYRGTRWYSWVLGVPTVALAFAAGITGYWLVWDRLAQYVAETTAEILDRLPIFGSPIARNFLAPSYVDDRFFTLMLFIHIALPLVMLFIMWFHVNRVNRPRINPPRNLAIASLVLLIALSLVYPALSQGPAELSRVPSPVNLDWYYLWSYPLVDLWGPGGVWLVYFLGSFALMIMPWLPPLKRSAPAVVDLDNCNGCTRCAVDCPYGAIRMAVRTDGKPFEREAVVNPAQCVSCGICTGACPTATPFRRAAALVPGIDLGGLPLVMVRERTHEAAAGLAGATRVVVFGCDHGGAIAALNSTSVGGVSLPCTGMLPPSMIDYVLSRRLAEGVVITGCRDGECRFRLGPQWTEERIEGKRDPQLRGRVPRERILRVWAGPAEIARLAREIASFQQRLATAGNAAAAPAPAEAGQTVVAE